jgi:hypothetical protein
MATRPKITVIDGEGGTGGKDSKEFDPWEFQNRGYDIDGFFTRSTGANGAPGEVKYMKFSPSILSAVANIVYSRQFPSYRNDQDFIRDAVVHRVRYINQKLADGETEDIINTHVKLSRIEARQLQMAEMSRILSLHEEAMRTAIDTGDMEFLQELIDDAESDLGDLRSVYRRKLEALIEKYRERLPQ